MSSSKSSNPKVPKKHRKECKKGDSGYSSNRETSPDFYEFLKMKIAPERFVKFEDFGEYQLERIFRRSGLSEFISTKNKEDEVFPEPLAMFYSNLKREGEKNKLVSNVHRTQLICTIEELGSIFESPFSW